MLQLEYVDKQKAFEFGMKDFYIHIRPFTLCFLNTISERYNIIFYSSMERDLLTYVLEHIQREKLFSTIAISNSKTKGIKRISKFWNESRTPQNWVIIDHDPEVRLPLLIL